MKAMKKLKSMKFDDSDLENELEAEAEEILELSKSHKLA